MEVLLNGKSFMTVTPETTTSPESGGFIDWLNGVADSFVQAEVNLILKPIGHALKEGFIGIIRTLNAHSIEVLTLLVMGCSIGMIVAPMMGSSSGRWFGRLVFVMVAGSIWRILI